MISFSRFSSFNDFVVFVCFGDINSIRFDNNLKIAITFEGRRLVEYIALE